MKQHILKIELRRMFTSPGMALAVVLSLALAIYHMIAYSIPASVSTLESTYPNSDIPLPHHFWSNWLGGGMLIDMPIYLYRLFLPILAVLPFASSYSTDIHSGFARQLLIRTNKHRYLCSKIFAVWLGGGVAAVMPMVFSFIGASAILPLRGPNPMTIGSVGSLQIFGELYKQTPLLYVFASSAILFAFCGAMALVALFFSLYIQQSFLIFITPFTFYLGADILIRRIAAVYSIVPDNYLPMQFLHPNQWLEGRPDIVFTEMGLLLLVFGGGFYLIASKRDTM